MRIVDQIGVAFPAGGCTQFACEVASRFHGRTITDPQRDPEFLARVAAGELRDVSGCERVDPPLQVGDIVVFGPTRRQHMGVVAEDGWVLHCPQGGSRLFELRRVLPMLLSAWRPRHG